MKWFRSIWQRSRASQRDWYLVVGLGNPGPRYADTRHNVGFWIAETLADRHGLDLTRQRHEARQGRGVIAGRDVVLALPQTFMNDSGRAVGRLARFYRVPPERILVMYDDVALDIGQLRLRLKGSAGGHKGVASIIQHLGTEEFPRLRFGIGPAPKNRALVDFVLSPFSRQELALVEERIAVAAEAAETCLAEGVEAAMNRFN